MRSKFHFQGHPTHPALIPFPFAFLTGAFFFDAAGWYTGNLSLSTTASHLGCAGVVTALIAAVPGFVDYLYTVPPNSSGKSRAAKHGILNLSAVVLFALAWWTRPTAPDPVSVSVLGIEFVGLVFLFIAGYMGGTLVARNQVSIDHRYAGAGKWREQQIEDKKGPQVVARTNELQVNQMKLLRLNGKRIVLARDEKGYVAFDDRCTHKGGSLAGGAMICSTAQCPWHGSQFDVRTGALKQGPAKEGIQVYRVEQQGDEVRLVL